MDSGTANLADATAGLSADRIVRVDLRLISYPMHNVGPGGTDLLGAVSERRRICVTIETQSGARGSYVGGQANSFDQAASCARAILGLDAFARELAYEQFRRQLRKEDRMGAGVVDCAMWDLAGKMLGMSVSQMLGGAKRAVPAYASSWFGGGPESGLNSAEAFADFAEECYGLGYRGFKIHGWTDGGIERDIAAILALGRRVGDRMALMHDSACSFGPSPPPWRLAGLVTKPGSAGTRTPIPMAVLRRMLTGACAR